MLFRATLIAATLFAAPAFAQVSAPQAPDPAFLEQAIGSFRDQRNEAMDKGAVADAKVRMITREVEGLKASVAQLQKENAELKAKHPEVPAPVAPPAAKQ